MARGPGLKAIPLTKVETLLTKQRSKCRDVHVPLEALRIGVRYSLDALPNRFQLMIPEEDPERTYGFTWTSIRQLASHAKMPPAAIEKMPASLALNVLRCMLETSTVADGRRLLIRLSDYPPRRVRAVLPASFARVDDKEVLEELQTSIHGTETQVTNVTVTEDVFSLRLVFGDEINLGTPRRPDPAFAGIDVCTSETGQHRLQVRHVMFRVVCTNGITEQIHHKKLCDADGQSLGRSGLRKLFRHGLDTAIGNGQNVAARLAESRERHVEKAEDEVRDIFREHRLGNPRGKVAQWILEDLARRRTLFGVPRWDVVQSFTQVAQGLEPGERRKFEDAMGGYLMETVEAES